MENWSRKTTDCADIYGMRARKLASLRLGEIKFNYPNSAAAAALVKCVKKPYLCVQLDGLIRKYGSYKNNNLCWSPTRWPYINREHKMADEKSELSTPGSSSGHHRQRDNACELYIGTIYMYLFIRIYQYMCVRRSTTTAGVLIPNFSYNIDKFWITV